MGRNTFYSFGIDMASGRNWTNDTMFQMYVLKSRTDRQERNLEFRFPIQFRVDDVLGRTRDVGIIDDGNFRLTGTNSGRMSCEHSNLTSLSRVHFVPPQAMDADAMQMICSKAGETTSMTDPYMIVKFNGPPDRSRAYG